MGSGNEQWQAMGRQTVGRGVGDGQADSGHRGLVMISDGQADSGQRDLVIIGSGQGKVD